MKKDIWLLSSIGIVAASVWGVLVFTIFFDGADDSTKTAADENESLGEFYEADSDEQLAAEDEENLEPMNSSNSSSKNEAEEDEKGNSADSLQTDVKREIPVTERGILPGDFTEIAPEGRVSVDDLLEQINEKTAE